MTRRKLRTRPYSWTDTEERVSMAVRFGLRYARKHDDGWTLTDAQNERAIEQATREVMRVLAEIVAFPRSP